jgi:alkylation response protein AidB-like acyl-CoA dehydrogenase
LISNQCSAHFLGAFTFFFNDTATTETFCKLLASEGLLALAWPKEHGGGGGSVWQQTVLREEMWAQHEPRGPQ